MEILIFCGIQATGKTSFYKEIFFKTHMPISLDQLKTRKRETRFIETCLLTHQPFVVDNTNPTKNNRTKYIINFKELPNWQKRGIGIYWETITKEGFNPVIHEKVLVDRRDLYTNFEPPMRDEYNSFILDIIGKNDTFEL